MMRATEELSGSVGTSPACRALGVTSLTPLGLPDGALADHLPTLASALDAAVRRTRPQVVFAPWVLERHPDHRAVPAALARTTTQVEVWGYEAHTPLHPTHAVPLADAAVAAKRRALAIHAATAGLAFDLEATLALARWRSLATRAGVGYAEAFHAVPAAELAELVAATTAAWERAVNPAAAPDGPRAPER